MMKIICCLFAFVIYATPSFAKSPEQVKSAFLYQIAKFTKFTESMDPPPISFCFYNVETGPGSFLKDKSELQINKKPIKVILVKKTQQISELSQICDITYIDETLENDILPLWTDTISLNTLTIGESIRFLEKGGIASLVQEGNKIRLYINKQHVLQHNFKVQSRLLAMAKFYPN
ncbi:YfiR family protein [Pseudoalteromonas sp. S2721]|uniref:YfiR family protein n=1 Tax=Pseudoalteromonas sp. S2721 TaxID=579526 RepID=UPI0020182A6B|nr:YfiR family protein [Pseudoalteromonas sp. S2721]